MTEKKKTAAVKKDADKAVDEVKQVAEQPAKKQPKAKEKAPVEQMAETKPEPKPETPVQPQAEKHAIPNSDKDGINVENNGNEIHITYPNRKDINYAFNEGAVGAKNSLVKYDKATIHDRLFDKESVQTKTVAYNTDDLTPDTISRLSKAIETARTINNEYRAERDAANEYFKELAGDKKAIVLGAPFKTIKQPNGDKEYKPSYFNGDIVKVGKHLIAAVDGSTDEATYVRLLETSRLPLDAKEYADKEQAVKKHLGIKDENIVKANINGKEQDVIKDTKRHIAYGADWQVSKVAAYEPKPEQAKAKKAMQTMAQ